ncbi:hypothetical protein FA95DRAFT_1239427 [Auriscalpium vulgare]|uniref:Uncharacterized protein n=1 Tax=Auriscalpium vulgare TaxID=40419 RepID=A0ACB8S8W5_9AGAM|nr:hypothetical protein FA95DRAFT_1239427 [Auriscalpium vulgare]
MPSMAVILKQGDAVRDAARRKAELAEKKRAVVEQRKREAETRIYKGGDKGGVDSDSDDDDGLLVVQDNMQVVAREEAAERTRRTAPTEGKRRQLEYALGHSKAITAIASPAKRSTLSKSPKKLMEVAGRPTFAREGLGMAMSKKEVNQMLWQSKESVDEHLRREKEEEWLKGGGQVSGYMDIVEGGGKDLLEQALKRRAEAAEEGAFEGEDDEDEDWQPERGSASPEAEPHDGNAGQQREEEDEVSRSEDASMDDEEDAENENLIRRARHRPLFRTGVVDSDAESDAPVPGPSSHPPPPSYVSPSFELSPSPLFKDAEPDFEFGNETDKENATGRKFDMGEDKENKAVARHGPLGRGLAFTPDSGEEPADSQPLSSLKSPLIPRADDPFALMRSPPREKQEALAHLQSPLPSMPLALALPEKDRKGGFSQFSDDDVGTTFTQSDSLGLMPAPFAGGGKVGKGLSQAFEQTQVRFDIGTVVRMRSHDPPRPP